VHLIRNPRGTNLDSFQEGLKAILERDPEMNMKDEAGLGLEIFSVQQALISAYDKNCPLKPVRTGKHPLKWIYKLKCLRREVRRIFNKCQADITPQSWEHYRETQHRYRKEVRKASKDAWRTLRNSVNDIPMSTKLNRALSRDPKIKLGSLVALSGRHTQSKGKTLALLLLSHFPNSVVTVEEAAPAAAR
jgi:hypothetical protein